MSFYQKRPLFGGLFFDGSNMKSSLSKSLTIHIVADTISATVNNYYFYNLIYILMKEKNGKIWLFKEFLKIAVCWDKDIDIPTRLLSALAGIGFLILEPIGRLYFWIKKIKK